MAAPHGTDVRISIHAPRGGSDCSLNPILVEDAEFQSTLPVGGATLLLVPCGAAIKISIHAPRGGSDYVLRLHRIFGGDFNPRSPWGERPEIRAVFGTNLNFNPRSPWGERHGLPFLPICFWQFQSTLPVGGATYRRLIYGGTKHISIHAPRGGSDHGSCKFRHILFLFQSTLPVGGATR